MGFYVVNDFLPVRGKRLYHWVTVMGRIFWYYSC